jgi:LIVCS family branched-chain amino acid:cation transporter
MKKQDGKQLLLVGFTLFSMFFGAGNLIFPPGLGAQAGIHTWPAMAGMAISAVGLPVLGVVAVARSGGLDALGGRVHPLFARVFTVAAYLAIGPCLAIPRTASTSFEMAVPPFAGPDAPLELLRPSFPWRFSPGRCWWRSDRKADGPAGQGALPHSDRPDRRHLCGVSAQPAGGVRPAPDRQL